MTESWEREFEVARIAHGDLNATIQTMLKEDYTIEEASYVLYDDADLIKAVLADPNWSGRILKNPLPPGVPAPPPPGQAPVPGSHAIHDTRMNLNVGGAAHNINAPEFGGGNALSRFFGAPSERHRKDLTSWFGRDALESAGIQPKEGFMSRLKSGQEMRNARRAAKRAQPGWFSTAMNEGLKGLQRRRQQRDAIDMATDVRQLGYDTATQGRAGEHAATLAETGLPAPPPPAALPAPEETPIGEEIPAEEATPPGDVAAPVESPATEEGAGDELPAWADPDAPRRGARKGKRPPKALIDRMGKGHWDALARYMPPDEGMSLADSIAEGRLPEGMKGMNETMRNRFINALNDPKTREQMKGIMQKLGRNYPFMAEGWEPPQQEEAPMSVAEANETLAPQEEQDFFDISDLLAEDETPTKEADLAQQVKNLIPQEDTSTETPDLPSMEEALEPKPDLTGQPVEEKENVGLLERGRRKQAEQEAKKKTSAGEFELDLDERPPEEDFFRVETSSDSMDMAWDHLTMLKRYE